MFENPSLCQKCGGHCCRQYPGYVYPSNNPEQQVRDLLSTGKYILVAWEKDENETWYNIRPKVKKEKGILNVSRYTNHGVCVFWTEKGCALSPDERPDDCQLLEPTEDNNCAFHGLEPYESFIKWVDADVDFEKILSEFSKEE